MLLSLSIAEAVARFLAGGSFGIETAQRQA
jgi:hypothetical protein